MGKRRRILEVCVNGIGGNEISISGNQKAGGGGARHVNIFILEGLGIKGGVLHCLQASVGVGCNVAIV